MPPKDPDAVIDYQCDWTDWLTDGETIEISQWFAPSDLIVTESTNSEQVATAWLTGGDTDSTYLLTNRITTTAGRIEDRTMRIRVTEK